MNNMKEQARELITLLRSNIPEEREKAAVIIFQEGIKAHKRIIEEMEGRPDDNGNGSRRSA